MNMEDKKTCVHLPFGSQLETWEESALPHGTHARSGREDRGRDMERGGRETEGTRDIGDREHKCHNTYLVIHRSTLLLAITTNAIPKKNPCAINQTCSDVNPNSFTGDEMSGKLWLRKVPETEKDEPSPQSECWWPPSSVRWQGRLVQLADLH